MKVRKGLKATKAKATKAARVTASNEPTFAERLREALLKHYKAAA